MQRRELLKMIAVITGSAVVGGDLLLSGCKHKEENFFTDEDIAFFDEVAETIIPRTNTPGAKDAATGNFMAVYAADCYDESNRKIFKDGISKLNEASRKKNDKGFMKLSQVQKQELLIEIDKDAFEYTKQNERDGNKKPAHYFTLMKQLALWGFFTSKPGVTQVLRYVPVPGKYEGCINYKKGETSWA